VTERLARVGVSAGTVAAWAALVSGAPHLANLFFPALLLLIQIFVVALGPAVGLSVAAGVVGFDLALGWAGQRSTLEVLTRAAFVALFAAAFGGVLRAEILRLRKRHRDESRAERERWLRDARDYRLIGSVVRAESRSPRPTPEREALRLTGSVQALRAWSRSVFELSRSATGADAIRLFVHTPEGRLRDVLDESGHTIAPSGAVAAVSTTRRPVHLSPRRDGPKLGYAPAGPVRAFVAVPVERGPALRGVLVAEAEEPDAFDERTDAILARTAAAVAGALEAERLFAEMDGTQSEQARFIEASRRIAEALGPRAVADRLAESTAKLVDADVVAVAVRDSEAGGFRVVAAHGESDAARQLAGHVLPDDRDNLVSQALEQRVPMPTRPLSEQSAPRRDRLLARPGLRLMSLRVFPIVHRELALGALIVGSTQDAKRLPRDVDSTLQAVTAHAAVSLANARMYARVEAMATRDGLTGLVNHRRFQELLREAVERVGRLAHQVSVVFVDADHFKTVNDTFGHPVGDEVLRRIARTLEQEARRTDVVARYGGEEFVMLLEGTGADGAAELAERVRARIEATPIEGDFGRLSVTVSSGVCTFPELASDSKMLLTRADHALYEAKRRGRNRVRVFDPAVCPEPRTSDKGRGGGGRTGPRVAV